MSAPGYMNSERDGLDVYAVKLGDVIEAAPLCSALSPEKVLLTCTLETKTGVEFTASYFGVVVGKASYDAAGGWTWIPI